MSTADLRAAWEKALEKDRPRDAIKALVELERLESGDPQWSQRLGEAYRRTGDTAHAVEAFVRAFERYHKRGFVPRALAMAKLVKTMDAPRGELMERALPAVGSSGPPPLPAGLRAAMSPPRMPALPLAVRPAPLSRAPDAKAGEIRFADAPDASIELSIADVELCEASDVITLDVDDVSLIPAVRSDAHAKMAAMRLFAVTSQDALTALASAAELVEVAAAEPIFKRDEPANALFAIVSGNAQVRVPGRAPIQLGEGDVFGEGSLLDEARRQASVFAETSLMVLRIDKNALDLITKAHPEIDDVLFDLLARRLVTNLIYTSPLFKAFEPDARVELAKLFEIRRADPGTVLAERGQRSDGLYVILSGNIMAEPASGEATRIARGTTFGHGSLLGVGASDVTIRVATEAVLVRMPASRFSALASQYPPVLAHLAETAADPLPTSLRRP